MLVTPHGRNWLKGALGDAMHAVLCGAGHNLLTMPKQPRLFAPSFSRLVTTCVVEARKRNLARS
jgi:hypothetical protein